MERGGGGGIRHIFPVKSLFLFSRWRRGREGEGESPLATKAEETKILPQKASMDVSLPSFLCLGNFKRIAQLKFITSNGTHLADLASYP